MTAAVARKAAEAPPAYAIFAPIFERLSAPTTEILFGHLEEFERLARTLDAPLLKPRGEFEGFSGLTLRGEISQIVQSELLLRTEAPLEFLRRLAESETLYHEKQYADPGARSVYRAMLSVGPGSLGHGRLLVLASLFFMARIAAARGADFHWCFLPRTEGVVWFDEISVNTVKRLLRAASYREMSGADAADAIALWQALHPEAARASETQPLDWVAGARTGRLAAFADGVDAAAEGGANAISWRLHGPRPGAPRTAEARVTQDGREHMRIALTFPDDRVCALALRNPFRPPPSFATAALPLPAASRPEPDGWAPRYVVGPADTKLIRLRGGLLVIALDGKQEPTGSWFLPLADSLQLGGVKVATYDIRLLVHCRADGALVLGSFYPHSAHPRAIQNRWVAAIPSEHLFRHQPAFALPTLRAGSGGTEFHSTAGSPFELTTTGAGAMTMKPDYKGARIIGSSGGYDILRAETEQGPLLRIRRPNGYGIAYFAEGAEAAAPPRLLGAVYSHAEASLAYSTAPGQWVLPPRYTGGEPPDAAAREAFPRINLRPHERLLMGRARGEATNARVWSDARLGGEGTVSNVRWTFAGKTVKPPVLDLGDDAPSVVKVELGQDGLIWALTADAEGEPAELLVYRRRKNSMDFACKRIDLREQYDGAEQVDTAPLHG